MRYEKKWRNDRKVEAIIVDIDKVKKDVENGEIVIEIDR